MVVDAKPITGTTTTGVNEGTPTNQDKKNKNESLTPKIPPPLPSNLSQKGKNLVDQLKTCAESCIKGKFFTPEVNKILLE